MKTPFLDQEIERLNLLGKTNTLSRYEEELITEYKAIKQALSLPNIVLTKPKKVCELIHQKFDDWVFGLETQAGEKLKVVDSSDFNEITKEIENYLKQ